MSHETIVQWGKLDWADLAELEIPEASLHLQASSFVFNKFGISLTTKSTRYSANTRTFHCTCSACDRLRDQGHHRSSWMIQFARKPSPQPDSSSSTWAIDPKYDYRLYEKYPGHTNETRRFKTVAYKLLANFVPFQIIVTDLYDTAKKESKGKKPAIRKSDAEILSYLQNCKPGFTLCTRKGTVGQPAVIQKKVNLAKCDVIAYICHHQNSQNIQSYSTLPAFLTRIATSTKPSTASVSIPLSVALQSDSNGRFFRSFLASYKLPRVGWIYEISRVPEKHCWCLCQA